MLIKNSQVLRLIIFGIIFLISSPLFSVQDKQETDQASTTQREQLRHAIELLENEEQRKSIIKLLKLIDTLDSEIKKDAIVTIPQEAEAKEGTPSKIKEEVEQLRRSFIIAMAGIPTAAKNFVAVIKILSDSDNLKLWYLYAIKIFCWGLFCLFVTKFIIYRYAALPRYEAGWKNRFFSVGRYLLMVTWPNILLICSFLFIPAPSTTATGVTADMGIALNFLHAFIQNIFITLSFLYISLCVLDLLFCENQDGLYFFNLPVNISAHLRHTWRIVAVYVALFIFIRSAFLDIFTSGYFYSISMSLLFLPVPFYATARIKKMKRLANEAQMEKQSSGDNFSADLAPSDDEYERAAASQNSGQNAIEYSVDNLMKRHWDTISIGIVWTVSLLFIFNPLNVADYFLSRVVSSFVLLFICLAAIKIERVIVLRISTVEMDDRDKFIVSIDSFVTVLIGILAFLSLINIWGLPVERFFRNYIVEDILARGFAIAVVLAVLFFFIKFSKMTTDWLLSVPGFAHNRNWRTVTPLVLTAMRAMAIFIGVVVILERLGVNVGPILAGAGILGLGVGMGAQSLVKDIINGISILLMDTLAVGDYVSIGGRSGTVQRVGLRTIRMRDAVGNLIVVPNSSVNDIVNMTRDYSQDIIEFVVPYDADPDKMLDMTGKVVSALDKDPNWQRFITSPSTVVGITAFDANGTTIRVKINTSAGHQWAVGRELRLRLKRAMLNAGLKSSWFGNNIFFYRGETGN